LPNTLGISEAAGTDGRIRPPESWPRLFEQIFRVDKWSVYRG
jgi:hypothetical protein